MPYRSAPCPPPPAPAPSASVRSTPPTTTSPPTTYDSKWGIDFGADRAGAGPCEAAQGARRASPEPFAEALEIGAGTGYFTLNLLQLGLIGRATATDISAGMLASLEANAAGPRPRGLDRGLRRRRAPVPRSAASTSSSATRSSTTFPTSSAPSPSSTASCGRAGRSPSAASPRATATASRRCRSGPACCWRPAWRSAVGAGPARAQAAADGNGARAGGRGGRALLLPRPAARRPRAGRLRSDPGAGRGAARQRLGLGAALGRGERRARHGADAWRRFAFRSYLALQRLDESLLEPRLPPQLFYNLCSRPRQAATRPTRLLAEGEGVAGDAGLEAQGRAGGARPAAGRPGGRGAGRRPDVAVADVARRPAACGIGLPSSRTRTAAALPANRGRGRPGGRGSRGRARSPRRRWRPRRQRPAAAVGELVGRHRCRGP